jgi:protein-tyrosine phosphatase
MARSNEDRQKVHLILELIYPNQFRDVPDPYYDGEDGFENVFQMLETACDIIANKLR